MNSKKLPLFIILAALPFLSFKENKADDGYYAFIVVDGIWKDHTGFASRIIYYPGYEDCNKDRDIDFFHRAKAAFSNHLKAYHTSHFPTGENNNFQIISNPQYSTSSLLKTRQQAEQRLTEWIAKQKEEGNSVRLTEFGYSCSN